MESFIVAGISLLILLLVIFILPIGLTFKGKVFVVVASFLLGIIGLGASLFVPLWQTGLILFLLVILATLLLNKIGGNWLYLTEVKDNPFFLEEENIVQPIKETNDTYSHISFSDKMPKNPIVEESDLSDLNEKKVANTFLEKLASDKEKNLSQKNGATNPNDLERGKDFGLHEIEVVPIEPQRVSDTGAKPTSQQIELESESIEEMDMIQPLPKKTHTTIDNNIDSDVESFVNSEQTASEVKKSASTEDGNTYDYMSDLEKMLEVEEHEIDTVQIVGDKVIKELPTLPKTVDETDKTKLDEKPGTDDKLVKQ